jgi:hypothetical protein
MQRARFYDAPARAEAAESHLDTRPRTPSTLKTGNEILRMITRGLTRGSVTRSSAKKRKRKATRSTGTKRRKTKF